MMCLVVWCKGFYDLNRFCHVGTLWSHQATACRASSVVEIWTTDPLCITVELQSRDYQAVRETLTTDIVMHNYNPSHKVPTPTHLVCDQIHCQRLLHHAIYVCIGHMLDRALCRVRLVHDYLSLTSLLGSEFQCYGRTPPRRCGPGLSHFKLVPLSFLLLPSLLFFPDTGQYPREVIESLGS